MWIVLWDTILKLDLYFFIFTGPVYNTRDPQKKKKKKKMQGNTQMRYPNSHYGVSAPPPWWSLVRKSVKWDDIKRKKCNSFFFLIFCFSFTFLFCDHNFPSKVKNAYNFLWIIIILVLSPLLSSANSFSGANDRCFLAQTKRCFSRFLGQTDGLHTICWCD